MTEFYCFLRFRVLIVDVAVVTVWKVASASSTADDYLLKKIAEQLVPTSVERILDLFFVYFQSFQSNNTIFKANQCEKCPSSIWALDLNPRPLEHELSNITTRPGLTVFFINKYMKSRAFKGTYSWRQYPGLDPQEWKHVYVKKLSSWWQIFLQK